MGKDVTLREGLDEYYRKNSRTLLDTAVSNDSELFFNCHDIAHVIFECDTSLQGEGAVKLWTIFGSTLGFVNHFKGYAEANAFELSKKYSLKHILANVPKVLIGAPVVISRARKMTKKWPWAAYDRYLDISIAEVREEFNIVPVSTQQ